MRKPYEYDYNKKERRADDYYHLHYPIVLSHYRVLFLFTRCDYRPVKRREVEKEQTGRYVTWINEQFWIALDRTAGQNDKRGAAHRQIIITSLPNFVSKMP